MKKIWNVEVRALNGTVTMMSYTHSFIDKELAEKASNTIKEKNKNASFNVVTRVYESELFESENEVPILNE